MLATILLNIASRITPSTLAIGTLGRLDGLPLALVLFDASRSSLLWPPCGR